MHRAEQSQYLKIEALLQMIVLIYQLSLSAIWGDYSGQIYSILNPKLENIFSESFPHINFVQSLDQDKFDFHLPVASLGEIFIKNKNDLIDNSKPYLFSKSCIIFDPTTPDAPTKARDTPLFISIL